MITSLGRTGTRFFAHLFQTLVPDCTSLHEPDVLSIDEYCGIQQRLQAIARQISEGGFYEMVLRKVVLRRGLRYVSDARARGEIDVSEAAARVIAQRRDFVQRQAGEFYIESSAALYGLVDVFPRAFTDHRAIFIIRNGRDWIRSIMNFSGAPIYKRSRLRLLFTPEWPGAPEFESDPYAQQWDQLPRFEKLCWAWTNLNEFALKCVNRNPNALVFRFEDLFDPRNDYEELRTMVRFATESLGSPVPERLVEAQLTRKIHKSQESNLPEYSLWADEQRRSFIEICGSLMNRMGYEL